VQVGSSRSGYPGQCPGSLSLDVSLQLVDGHDDHSCFLSNTIPHFMSVRHLAQKIIGSMNGGILNHVRILNSSTTAERNTEIALVNNLDYTECSRQVAKRSIFYNIAILLHLYECVPML
jgi:hypothetical protein